VHRAAFGATEGATIAKLVGELLEDETARPTLSLVAEVEGQLVGSVLFSRVVVEGHEELAGHILAPLAVDEAQQGRGVGSALIARGLELLRERGTAFVLVLGDPRYYSRAGFGPSRDLIPPHELEHPEAWMVQELQPGVLDGVQGPVRCALSLSAPEHW